MNKFLLVLLLVTNTVFVRAQLTNGMVAHWDFNGNTNDVTGNNLHATPFNITYAQGMQGLNNTAAQFNGTSSYALVPYDSKMNLSTYTLCAIIKINGFYQGTCQGNFILFRGSEGQSGSYGFGYFDNAYNSCSAFDPTKHVFYGQAGNSIGNINDFQSNIKAQTGQWYCLCVVYDGSTIKTYVNSTLASTLNITSGTLGTSSNPIGIGKYLNGGTSYPYWINGLIDDLRLYNRALSKTEIDSFCNIFASPVITPEVSIAQPVSKTSFCPGDQFQLHYTVTAQFNPGNVFTAQLSDATGSFATPVAIGSTTAVGPGVINCTIPVNTPPGTGYRVRVSASNPAKTSADNGVNLTVFQAPSIAISGDTAVCIGDTLKLFATVNPAGIKINWTGPGSFSDTGKVITIPNADYPDSGKYIVTTSNGGCTATDTITAIVGNVTFELGNDTVICNDETLMLYTGVKGATHLWQDGSTADTFKTQTSGTYFVKASLGSCSHTDTIDIEVQHINMHLPGDTVICPKTSITISVPDTFDKYVWNIALNTPSITVDKGGKYWLTVTKGKCSLTDSILVEEHEPYFLLGNDTMICIGRELTLTASSIPGSRYVWQDGTLGETYVVKEKGLYHVTANNMCGSFSSNIYVDYFACECYPFMAGAFTPDGNGLNDDIGPRMDCVPREFKFTIVNRRGEVVFKTEVFGNRWDGLHYGVPAGMDTYFYMIQITDILGNKTMHKGDFLLMR